MGTASIKNIDMSQLVPSAGNQPTAVKDSGQYTMQQLSETVRRTITPPTLIIHNITHDYQLHNQREG